MGPGEGALEGRRELVADQAIGNFGQEPERCGLRRAVHGHEDLVGNRPQLPEESCHSGAGVIRQTAHR